VREGLGTGSLKGVKTLYGSPVTSCQLLHRKLNDREDVLARLRAYGAELVGEVAQYEDMYRLCYIRGPEGIIVALAEQLGQGVSGWAQVRLAWRQARLGLANSRSLAYNTRLQATGAEGYSE